ncbi:uncharacterized protein [Miscanthus floridulus]|uniref:uncharacterized protein isoform X2 n=1 Tax=Miscanthus floridulus TaxID=154761 RepID=UPI00345AEEFC
MDGQNSFEDKSKDIMEMETEESYGMILNVVLKWVGNKYFLSLCQCVTQSYRVDQPDETRQPLFIILISDDLHIYGTAYSFSKTEVCAGYFNNTFEFSMYLPATSTISLYISKHIGSASKLGSSFML